MAPLLCVPQGLKRAICALGDDTIVKGAYHLPFGVTETSGKVTTWADARGSGYGPSVTVGSAPYDSSGLYLELFAPVSAYTAAGDTPFTCGVNCWIGFVGAVGTDATFDDVCDFIDLTSDYGVIIGTESAGEWAGYQGGDIISYSVTDATAKTIRFVWNHQTITNTGTGACTVGGQVYDHAVNEPSEFANIVTKYFLALNTYEQSTSAGEDDMYARTVFFCTNGLTTDVDVVGPSGIASVALWAIATSGIQVAS